MPVLFLLPALSALTLSLSCRAPDVTAPASDGCEIELAMLSCLLAMRGIGGSIGGCRPTTLFLSPAALIPSPSLVFGLTMLSSLGLNASTESMFGGWISKSKVICKGLTIGGGMLFGGAIVFCAAAAAEVLPLRSWRLRLNMTSV